MFKSGLDMMAFWDTIGNGEYMLMDKNHDYRMNPVHFGLEMLFRSIEMDMFEMDTSAYRLHGFCARPKDDNSRQICFLLNKYDNDKRISFSSNKFKRNTKVSVEILVDTDDHWGKVLSGNTTIMDDDEVFNYNIPALSFATLTFEEM